MDREAKSPTHTADMLESGPPDSTSTIYVSSTVTVHPRDDTHWTSHTHPASMIESASPVSTSTSYSSIPTYQAARDEAQPTGLPHITTVEPHMSKGHYSSHIKSSSSTAHFPAYIMPPQPARDEDYHTRHGHPHALNLSLRCNHPIPLTPILGPRAIIQSPPLVFRDLPARSRSMPARTSVTVPVLSATRAPATLLWDQQLRCSRRR
jgi:hypothetical protein